MTKEIWRKISGFSNYRVSNKGRVLSLKNNRRRLMRPATTNDGYKIIGLINDDGKREGPTIHALVALAFIGPRPKGFVICHNDDNPSNNVPENLRYDTNGNNIYERVLKRHSKYKEQDITLDLARAIKMSLLAKVLTTLEVAQKYSVTHLSVLKIDKGDLFSNVHEEVSRLFLM